MDFIKDDEFIESILREKARKETKYEETLAELELYKQKERLENKEKEKNEFERLKSAYAVDQWKKTKKEKWKDFVFLVFVFMLNVTLCTTAILITLSPTLKKWLSKFESNQKILISIYILIIVIEIIGSKYLFNKERLKNGWSLLTIMPRYKTFKKKHHEISNNDFEKL